LENKGLREKKISDVARDERGSVERAEWSRFYVFFERGRKDATLEQQEERRACAAPELGLDSPERRVEHDDQVEVDEESEVLPEQRLLQGAAVPAHLALARRLRRRGRLLLGQRRR